MNDGYCDQQSVPRYYRSDAKVFKFESHIEVEGIYRYPEERADEKTQLTIYGSNSGRREFELMLADCHVRNDDGSRQYRRVGGKEVPVYDVPNDTFVSTTVRCEDYPFHGGLMGNCASIAVFLTPMPPTYFPAPLKSFRANLGGSDGHFSVLFPYGLI